MSSQEHSQSHYPLKLATKTSSNHCHQLSKKSEIYGFHWFKFREPERNHSPLQEPKWSLDVHLESPTKAPPGMSPTSAALLPGRPFYLGLLKHLTYSYWPELHLSPWPTLREKQTDKNPKPPHTTNTTTTQTPLVILLCLMTIWVEKILVIISRWGIILVWKTRFWPAFRTL